MIFFSVQSVQQSIVPNVDINPNLDNAIKIPDGSLDPYANGYYPPNLQYQNQQNQAYPQHPLYTYPYNYPWIFGAAQNQPQQQQQQQQQLPSNAAQSNLPPNAQMYAPQPSRPAYFIPKYVDYEAVLVPVETQSSPAQGQSAQVYAQPSAQTHHINSSKNTRVNTKMTVPRTSYDLAMLLQSLFPPNILQTILTMINFALNSFSMLAFAAAITSAICSITPLCTLTFGVLPLGLQKRMSEESGSTIQRVRRAVVQVESAIDKYERLQKNIGKITQMLNPGKNAWNFSTLEYKWNEFY